MKISDSSSPDSQRPAPPRKRHHLTGPSVELPADTFAVRRDLAEIAVADRVFAQHYVEPLPVRLLLTTEIHASPRNDSLVVGDLAVGDYFHVLDIGREWAWGRTATPGGVGYVALSALDLAE